MTLSFSYLELQPLGKVQKLLKERGLKTVKGKKFSGEKEETNNRKVFDRNSYRHFLGPRNLVGLDGVIIAHKEIFQVDGNL